MSETASHLVRSIVLVAVGAVVALGVLALYGGRIDPAVLSPTTRSSLGTDLAESVENIREASEKLNDIADMLRSQQECLAHLSNVSENLDIIIAKMASGTGTIGKLINDEQLYRDFVLTMQRINGLCYELTHLVRDWGKNGMNIRGVGLFK